MNPPMPPNMISQLELLEEKFRRVEQESERRVLDGPDERRDPVTVSRKHHKKPTVSISQFGKQEGQGEGLHSPAPSPLSAVASKSTFYHTLANPRSVDSFASDKSEQATLETEEEHEIQVERISGRQSLPKSVGALLPRRLTRAQSQVDYVSITKGMVIDVSVETTTELSCFSPSQHMSTAYATRPSRPRAATVDILNLACHVGLMERAKGFARKLRRKSRGEVP